MHFLKKSFFSYFFWHPTYLVTTPPTDFLLYSPTFSPKIWQTDYFSNILMFIHHHLKFGILKIGGEFISQSWPLQISFSQLPHSALEQVRTELWFGNQLKMDHLIVFFRAYLLIITKANISWKLPKSAMLLCSGEICSMLKRRKKTCLVVIIKDICLPSHLCYWVHLNLMIKVTITTLTFPSHCDALWFRPWVLPSLLTKGLLNNCDHVRCGN